MFCVLKMRKSILLTFKKLLKQKRNKLFFNDSKRRRMALSCSKKMVIYIV